MYVWRIVTLPQIKNLEIKEDEWNAWKSNISFQTTVTVNYSVIWSTTIRISASSNSYHNWQSPFWWRKWEYVNNALCFSRGFVYLFPDEWKNERISQRNILNVLFQKALFLNPRYKDLQAESILQRTAIRELIKRIFLL